MHHRLFSFGAADDGHNSCLIRQLQFQGSIVRFLLVQLETHNAPTVRCSFSANIKRQMQAAAFDNLEHDVSLVLVRLDQIVKAHRPFGVCWIILTSFREEEKQAQASFFVNSSMSRPWTPSGHDTNLQRCSVYSVIRWLPKLITLWLAMIFKVKDMRASGELHSILSLPITRGDYGRGLSAGGQDSGQGKEEIPFRQRAVSVSYIA
ncbi:hypothetical protein QX201_000433 [Fusarium graminearum]